MADDPTSTLAAAAQALGDFASGPVVDATSAIEGAVTKSFNAVAKTIADAAVSGKLSMDQLVSAILADFERIAISQFIVKPIEGLINSLAGSVLPVAGALAGGGPVSAGGTYLVGEQGPELFTPAGAGTITSNGDLKGAMRPQIVLNVQTQDASSFLKSRSQIAAAMSRALALGQRNL
jgi:phage-related minor tail protein